MAVKIITPYVFDEEIKEHQNMFWDLDIYYEKDVAGIGCDLMFQKMWNKFPEDDIFILHADMSPTMMGGLKRYKTMLKNIQKQECLVAYYFTPLKMQKIDIMYNAVAESLQMKNQIISEVDSFLKMDKSLNPSWNSIQVSTMQFGKLHGQRLEDVILDDPLLTRLGISTQLTSGHTTETWITAFEDEKPVNVYIRFQSDSFITNLETRNE